MSDDNPYFTDPNAANMGEDDDAETFGGLNVEVPAMEAIRSGIRIYFENFVKFFLIWLLPGLLVGLGSLATQLLDVYPYFSNEGGDNGDKGILQLFLSLDGVILLAVYLLIIAAFFIFGGGVMAMVREAMQKKEVHVSTGYNTVTNQLPKLATVSAGLVMLGLVAFVIGQGIGFGLALTVLSDGDDDAPPGASEWAGLAIGATIGISLVVFVLYRYMFSIAAIATEHSGANVSFHKSVEFAQANKTLQFTIMLAGYVLLLIIALAAVWTLVSTQFGLQSGTTTFTITGTLMAWIGLPVFWTPIAYYWVKANRLDEDDGDGDDN